MSRTAIIRETLVSISSLRTCAAAGLSSEMWSTMAIRSATAVAFHSRSRTTLSVNQRLRFVQHLLVRKGRSRVVQGLTYLGTEPRIMRGGI